jgi:hypothetical protein
MTDEKADACLLQMNGNFNLDWTPFDVIICEQLMEAE